MKLDELIRVSQARNELIGSEDESHGQLAERREEVLRETRGG
jgi:low affinity Fe/Cu permease